MIAQLPKMCFDIARACVKFLLNRPICEWIHRAGTPKRPRCLVGRRTAAQGSSVLNVNRDSHRETSRLNQPDRFPQLRTRFTKNHPDAPANADHARGPAHNTRASTQTVTLLLVCDSLPNCRKCSPVLIRYHPWLQANVPETPIPTPLTTSNPGAIFGTSLNRPCQNAI